MVVKNPGFFKDARRLVEKVTWNDAKSFVKKLSEQTGMEYRLLSKSEWEYMARTCSTPKYLWGDGLIASRRRTI